MEFGGPGPKGSCFLGLKIGQAKNPAPLKSVPMGPILFRFVRGFQILLFGAACLDPNGKTNLREDLGFRPDHGSHLHLLPRWFANGRQYQDFKTMLIGAPRLQNLGLGLSVDGRVLYPVGFAINERGKARSLTPGRANTGRGARFLRTRPQTAPIRRGVCPPGIGRSNLALRSKLEFAAAKKFAGKLP